MIEGWIEVSQISLAPLSNHLEKDLEIKREIVEQNQQVASTWASQIGGSHRSQKKGCDCQWLTSFPVLLPIVFACASQLSWTISNDINPDIWSWSQLTWVIRDESDCPIVLPKPFPPLFPWWRLRLALCSLWIYLDLSMEIRIQGLARSGNCSLWLREVKRKILVGLLDRSSKRGFEGWMQIQTNPLALSRQEIDCCAWVKFESMNL